MTSNELQILKDCIIHISPFNFNKLIMNNNPTVINKYKTFGKYTYIGRGSRYGNPFTVEKHGRDECIQMHREMIFEYLKNKPDSINELITGLHGKVLGCFCKPKPCHGDTYVEILSKLKELVR